MESRQTSATGASDLVPDLMNDPQYATNTGDDSNGDGDTCRICRGEATEQEPLFYPCKCSGSIKFVHQECLMEWLSHSQKKYCELCKTPFRFTKLYSPDMPSTLPTLVFLRHLIVHGFQNLLVWLRFCLVIIVWLGCLPWAMRQVWGFLFWLGDSGWTSNQYDTFSNSQVGSFQELELAQIHLSTIMATGTSPASPLLQKPKTSANFGVAMSKIPELLRSFSQTLNLSTTDPLAAGFFKSIYYGLGFDGVFASNSSSSDAIASEFVNRTQSVGRPSLLSEVSFLNNLTSSSRLNRIIITTVEGHIITLVVVICFILVFLIREWVVQQQPGINMGAGFNAEFAGAGADGGRNRIVLPEDPQNGLDEQILPLHPIDLNPQNVEDAGDHHRPGTVDEMDSGLDHDEANDIYVVEEVPEIEIVNARPTMPSRDSVSSAVEIQRRLTDDTPSVADRIDAGEFISVWRRAAGNPDTVLKIIEEEGLEEKLHYWKSAIKSLQQANALSTARTDNVESTNGIPSRLSTLDNLRGQQTMDTNSSEGSWVDVPAPLHNETISESAQEDKEKPSSIKGKEKASEVSTEPLFDPSFMNFTGLPGLGRIGTNNRHAEEATSNHVPPLVLGRPRATSDGPVSREISPLANHNWSFSDLPSAPPNEPRENATNHDQDANWKAAQTLRVQNAVAQALEKRAQAQASIQDEQPISKVDTSAETSLKSIEVQSGDKTILADSWDEIFDNNMLSESENDSDDDPDTHQPENNPFHPDGLLPEQDPPLGPPPAVNARQNEPHGIFGPITEWLWGDMGANHDGQAGDDEHIVEDIAAEAPFVPVIHHAEAPPIIDAEDQEGGRDGDVLAAALAAGIDPNDPEGLEDAEDFDGIMELVGMRGPLAGLVQNALFSAVLISLTVTFGVWIPYNVGRVTLIMVANPIFAMKLPLKLLFSLAAAMQDFALVFLGGLSYLGVRAWEMRGLLFSFAATGPSDSIISSGSRASEFIQVARAAGERISDGVINTIVQMPESEVPAFSAISHESLQHIKRIISAGSQFIGFVISSLLKKDPGDSDFARLKDLSEFWPILYSFGRNLAQGLAALIGKLTASDAWVISLELPERINSIDPTLANWSSGDRFWAILAGYISFSLLGAAYLRKGSPFSTSQVGREWEATIIDILNQAGGVMKVILIISIEMLVFPLYCGLLLDIALLPLFDNATTVSRVVFTMENPLTSIFVHWFVGTCYMFHFALFVSMCRKIMRSGVLYFIRDPDDPTFHPVRDVLERNVATQLRKITFSAMVYGALVVICLGGVVWGLAFAFPGVLPIHWSSNEPVLEFPIDLLFYNFLMPLAVKFFKPSDGLHAMYAWWFRKCARFLRLTWFLFDERKLDEEGRHVRKTWYDFFSGAHGDPSEPIRHAQKTNPFDQDPNITAYFLQDGRYVRTPASDQVRIAKGEKVFLEVNEGNERVDGALDHDDGQHGRKSELFKMVYIPHYFRLRIFLFILLIWLFAATTGVCFTIVPLVFGRRIFSRIIPQDVKKNDVYAFSIGIYILGCVIYALLHIKDGISYARKVMSLRGYTADNALRHVSVYGLWILRLFYTYAAFGLVLPTLFSLVVECYFLIPLHTFFAPTEPHIIQFVPSLTLGLLYVKLSSQLILWYADSRPAEALRAVTRKGYFDPDIRIATRCFILPATVLFLTALVAPISLAHVANQLELFGVDPMQQMLVYRYSYPMFLSLAINLTGAAVLWGIMKGWRLKIRDEVYLIGERLHNFGDRSKSGVSNVALPSSNRVET